MGKLFDKYGVYYGKKNITAGHRQVYLDSYGNRIHTLGITTSPETIFSNIRFKNLKTSDGRTVYMHSFVFDLADTGIKGVKLDDLSAKLSKSDIQNIQLALSGGHKGSDK